MTSAACGGARARDQVRRPVDAGGDVRAGRPVAAPRAQPGGGDARRGRGRDVGAVDARAHRGGDGGGAGQRDGRVVGHQARLLNAVDQGGSGVGGGRDADRGDAHRGAVGVAVPARLGRGRAVLHRHAALAWSRGRAGRATRARPCRAPSRAGRSPARRDRPGPGRPPAACPAARPARCRRSPRRPASRPRSGGRRGRPRTRSATGPSGRRSAGGTASASACRARRRSPARTARPWPGPVAARPVASLCRLCLARAPQREDRPVMRGLRGWLYVPRLKL